MAVEATELACTISPPATPTLRDQHRDADYPDGDCAALTEQTRDAMAEMTNVQTMRCES